MFSLFSYNICVQRQRVSKNDFRESFLKFIHGILWRLSTHSWPFDDFTSCTSCTHARINIYYNINKLNSSCPTDVCNIVLDYDINNNILYRRFYNNYLLALNFKRKFVINEIPTQIVIYTIYWDLYTGFNFECFYFFYNILSVLLNTRGALGRFLLKGNHFTRLLLKNELNIFSF